MFEEEQEIQSGRNQVMKSEAVDEVRKTSVPLGKMPDDPQFCSVEVRFELWSICFINICWRESESPLF